MGDYERFRWAKVPVATANNGDFVLNAIEALSGGSNLMELRGRGTASRPFEALGPFNKRLRKNLKTKNASFGKLY